MAYFYGPASSQKLLQIIFFLTFPVRITGFFVLFSNIFRSSTVSTLSNCIHSSIRCPVNALFNSNNTSTIPCFWYLKQMFCAIVLEIIAHFLLHFYL